MAMISMSGSISTPNAGKVTENTAKRFVSAEILSHHSVGMSLNGRERQRNIASATYSKQTSTAFSLPYTTAMTLVRYILRATCRAG